MLKIQLEYLLKDINIRVDINDEIPKIYAIRGPSGIGKTTVLNIIAGLKKADRALIKVNNRILTDTENKLMSKFNNVMLDIYFKIISFFQI